MWYAATIHMAAPVWSPISACINPLCGACVAYCSRSFYIRNSKINSMHRCMLYFLLQTTTLLHSCTSCYDICTHVLITIRIWQSILHGRHQTQKCAFQYFHKVLHLENKALLENIALRFSTVNHVRQQFQIQKQPKQCNLFVLPKTYTIQTLTGCLVAEIGMVQVCQMNPWLNYY